MKLHFRQGVKRSLTSVIIPVYRDASGLGHTLASLSQQSLDAAEFEVLVANDGGSSEVTALCERHRARELPIVPRRGSYYGRNRALEVSAGEYLAFVDADITVPSDWLERGRASLQEAAYVGGGVRVPAASVRTPAHYFESKNGFPGRLYMERSHFAVTANLFVLRQVFEELGGFDERLHSGGDNEFGKRVHRSGRFRQRFEEGLSVEHPPRGYRKLVRKRLRTLNGEKQLSRLYPELYTFRRPKLASYLLQTVLPPRIRNVRAEYAPGSPFSFLCYYLFCYGFKLEVNLRRLPVYFS